MSTPMTYRSTNLTGAVHYGHALVAGGDEGYGIELNPASTGTAGPVITACGDDANIPLVVVGKGTGGVVVGNSSSVLQLGNSTSQLLGIDRYLIQFASPQLAATTSAESTFTVTGLSTTSMLVFNTMTSSGAWIITPRCSTANELVLKFTNPWGSTFGTGQSTGRGFLYAFKF